jgi:hypothetical protein
VKKREESLKATETKKTLSLEEAKALGHQGKTKEDMERIARLNKAYETGDFSSIPMEDLVDYEGSEDLEREAEGVINVTPTVKALQAKAKGDESLNKLASLIAKDEKKETPLEEKPKTRLAEPSPLAFTPRYLEGDMPRDQDVLQLTPLQRALGKPLTIKSSSTGFTYAAPCKCCKKYWQILSIEEIKQWTGYVAPKRQPKHTVPLFQVPKDLRVKIFDKQLDPLTEMTERQRVDALIDVFQKTRFYSGNRKKSPSSREPCSLYAAWNEFLRNYEFGGSQHFEKSLKRGDVHRATRIQSRDYNTQGVSQS